MNCSEVFDRFGDVIDRDLPKDLRADFFRHLELCPLCRNKYEIEVVAKSVVRKTLHTEKTPDSLCSAIRAMLRREYESLQDSSGKSWFERLLASPLLTPLLAGSLAIVALTLFLSEPHQAPNGSAPVQTKTDIVAHSLDNFRLIKNGSLTPTVVLCDPDSVIDYFKTSGVSFPAEVRRLKDCNWYGAIANEIAGVRLAHVVYKVRDEMMYVFEVSKDQVNGESPLTMTAEVRNELESSGWYYADAEEPGQNLILWLNRGVVCAAVSTMKKEQMLELLASN